MWLPEARGSQGRAVLVAARLQREVPEAAW